MHDPATQAFQIKYPWRKYPKGDKMWPDGYRETFITIWHNDPETDGTDDSCGWFKRARHGDKAVLDRIIKRFDEDWDRTWTYDPEKDGGNDDEDARGKVTYMCGYFNTGGMPQFSAIGVTLNLFFLAACEHFKCDGRSNWKKAKRFMRRNLFDIMLFAENPMDSLYDGLTLKFGNDTSRQDRIRNFAQTIYGWILRETQPWYRHPRWHVHHWSLQIHPLQSLKRRFIDKCSICGQGFKSGESACSGWNGDAIWHDRCNDSKKKPA